jgi:methylated-DNA-[protein]-cysteine S-methyltransferase
MPDLILFSAPIGTFEVTSSPAGICKVRIEGIKRANPQEIEGTEPLLLEARTQILAYLSGQRRSINLLLDLSGLGYFARQVLELTQTIPFGETRSYGQLAEILGKPAAARAVGAALAANPLLLVIPCHRVIAANRHMTGYAGGMDIKVKLLELEGHRIVGEKLV